MKADRMISMIGLAKRAGKLVSGEFSTEQTVKNGSARLVIVAGDASDNTKKLFSDKCTYYKVPIIITKDKEKLGQAIGKEFRASVGILDESFAKAIIKINEERADAYESS